MKVTLDLKSIWKNNKGWILTGVVAVLGTVYGFTKDIIDDYTARQHAIEFKADLILAFEDEEVVDSLFACEAFVDVMFESDIVKEKEDEIALRIGLDVRNFIIEDIIKDTTKKVSTRAELSRRLDIREENYFPLLEKALRAVLKEENASKADAKNIAKKQIKRSVKPSAVREEPSF